MLTAYGADDITEATNGEEAVKRMTEQNFDIVLCDYNLGEGKDGQQVLEEAKELNLLPYSSVFIMSTAENSAEMVMGAAEYQPDDYLSKPFTKQVLQTRLKRLLERKDSLRKISSAMQRRDFSHALQLCQQQLEQQPANRLELLKLQGELHFKLEQYAEAEAVYQSVIAERELPWAQLGLGMTLYQREQYEEAKTVFEHLVKSQPGYVFGHDWLAKTLVKLGDPAKAQELLVEAVQKSPKAVLRQRALAEISHRNEDFDTAEDAYKRVMRISKYSCYKSPTDFAGLSRVYLASNNTVEALKTLSSMKKEFRSAKPNSRLQALVVEAQLYLDLGQEENSRPGIEQAMRLFRDDPAKVTTKLAMELAQGCYNVGMKEEGDEVIRYIVRNNHDDQKILNSVQAMMEGCGNAEEASKLIAQTRDEVVTLNNRGVELATNGALQDSIKLFSQAAQGMPENLVINLNAAQSLIMFMQKYGAVTEFLEQAQGYLARASALDRPSAKQDKLSAAYRKLVNSMAKT
jgi:tetratricopeptide (TPR) repeat protein